MRLGGRRQTTHHYECVQGHRNWGPGGAKPPHYFQKHVLVPHFLGQVLVANQPKLYTHTEMHTSIREAIQPSRKSTLGCGITSPPQRRIQTYRKGGQKRTEALHCLWFDKVRPKIIKKGHSQLTIAAHLNNHAFIADKVHKNP